MYMSNKIYEPQIKRADGSIESVDIKTSVNAVEGISAYANLSASNTFSKDNTFSGNLSVGGMINNITIPTATSDTFALLSDVQTSVKESALVCVTLYELSSGWTSSDPIYYTTDCFNRTPVAGDVFYCITKGRALLLAQIQYKCYYDFSTGTEYSIPELGAKEAWKSIVLDTISLQGNTGSKGATGKPGCSFSLDGTVLTITWNEEDPNQYAVTMTFTKGTVSKAVSTSGNIVTGNLEATNRIITDTVTDNDVITITFAAGVISSPTFVINGTSYAFTDSEVLVEDDFTGFLICNSSDNTAVLRLTNITANLTLTVSSY